MKQHGNQLFGLRLRRLLSSLLCAAVLCGLLPVSLAGTARAAEVQLAWSDEDLETLRSYDIMRGDEGGMRPNDTIRRSEFAAMVNRALGYTERAGKNPFKDVTDKDWFFDDISISYNMGYLNGTSPTTVSPNGTLTREEALVILGRNLMLQPKAGESFSFADSRTFSSWSRGYLDPAVEAGIIDADSTGNFTPKKIITRGELAGMVVRAIGTPIQTPGVKNLDTVNGNVTITASGVTLRNTTINGDLYLTGGIGLGDVLLDNVTVNGRIVDSGAGLSEKGEISVALNNVTADELIVDSMRNQTISLSARGRTLIPKTSIRTPARVEDSTAADYGLRLIEIDGEDKTAVTLSGNIKEVHNKTPGSSLNIGEGVAEKVTVDEAAVDSTVTVGKDARIKYLNLDAGVKVSGSGSVDSLTVSANGATVTLPQAPDEIIIAPGITATINKQKMDTAAALEASSRPRLMPGYPEIQDLAPTSATALFKTNKPSTVYWAVTALADGSPSEEEIISPPSYAKKILKSGSVKVKESNKEYTVKISGLTSDGSYYLSTIVMDDKGSRSTMKVAAFTTPDNTTPAFSKGYPAEHEISEQNAQFAVMTTKSCNLYYALLPKGSTAPRAADFKAGSISGNLGYGVVKMEKNNPAYIFVNDVTLEEQKEYVLYLWLNDFDGAKSSAVKAMNFTTQDKTNPIISNLRQTDTKTTSSILSYSLSEQGTLYWAVVATGNETFMSPSSTTVTNVPFLETQEAKERVVSGVGALRKGSSPVTAAKAGADIGFTVSGLNSKTTGTSAYDLYYVARDKAGNWSDSVQKITIYTLDTNAPKAQLKFTSFNQDDTETTKEPLGDTDIKIAFSKAVCVVDKDSKGITHKYPFLDLYQQGKFTELADALRKHVLLYKVPTSGSAVLAQDEVKSPANYDIDYSKARVYMEGTDMVLEFPYDTDSTRSAHHLANGGEYYFLLKGIQDTTTKPNLMGETKLDFKVKQAQVAISTAGISELTYNGQTIPVDFSFRLDPKATSSSPEGIFYDVLLWCDTNITVDVYRRPQGGSTWEPILAGASTTPATGTGAFEYNLSTGDEAYVTTQNVKKGSSNTYPYEELRKFTSAYEYAVTIRSQRGNTTRGEWNITGNMGVSVASGNRQDLQALSNYSRNPSKGPSFWTTVVDGTVKNSNVVSIGDQARYTKGISITDSVAPKLRGTYPSFTVSDVSARMVLQLDRPGTIRYVVTPAGRGVPGTLLNGQSMDPGAKLAGKTDSDNGRFDYVDGVPMMNGKEVDHTLDLSEFGGKHGITDGRQKGESVLSRPTVEEFLDSTTNDPEVRQGRVENNGTGTTTVDLEKLTSDTWYYVYLICQGNDVSDYVVCYKFKTEKPYTPVLNLITEGSEGSGTVLAEVTRTSANVRARLINLLLMDTTFYSHKMDGTTVNADGKTDQETLGFTFLKAGAPVSVQNMTIFNAMMRPAQASADVPAGATQFDAWASDALKQEVASRIDIGDIGAESRALEIPINQTKPMVFDKIAKDTDYFCVAVAMNISDPTRMGFRSVQPVSTIDTKPPIVDDAYGTLTMYRENIKGLGADGTPNAGTTVDFVLRGEITVQYQGNLYVLAGGTGVPFTQAAQSGTNGRKQYFYYDETNYTIVPDTEAVKNPARYTRYGGVDSVNLGRNYKVNPIDGYAYPERTKTLFVEVEINIGTYPYVRKQIQNTTTGPDGKPITTTETVWEMPEFPKYSGTIPVPSGFVTRNGTPTTSPGKITYQNSKVGEISFQVSYKK